MSDLDQDSLEELLKQASPRPVPSQTDKATVRAAVREEWRLATSTQRSRRRIRQYAVAATVLLGAFAALSVLRTTPVEAIRVASIERSIGPVFILGDESQLHAVDETMYIKSGQTLVTSDGAGLAIAWDKGGSLRIGANTRIEITDAESVFLVSGRAYFDSLPDAVVAAVGESDTPAFVLRTEFGDIYHVGTQYMGEVIDSRLVVSVREGQVLVDGRFHEHKVSSGHQLSIAGTQQPSTLSISRSGSAWDWVSQTMPPRNVDGETVHQFLTWVCREMGLELQFEGQAEEIAKGARLKGTIDTQPAEALRLRLVSAALDWRIKEGVIYISDKL